MTIRSIEFVYDLVISGHRITTDSRAIRPNDIFLALKGDKFDGNDFALEALEKGAMAAIVSRSEFDNNPNCIFASNTLEFLHELARYHRDRLNIPIIGLTGSNGKTTSKELISTVLASKYNTFATQGNLNNHIGVPLSVLSINTNHQIAVIEMGANHVGEIATLCSICKPTLGLITNIGKAHLEGFGSIEGVIKAKTELYAYAIRNNSIVFYNSDNPILSEKIENFGLKSNAIAYGSGMQNTKVISDKGTFLVLKLEEIGSTFTISTQLTGTYNVENILAAWAIGRHFGIDPDSIVKSIESYIPTNSRSQIVETSRNTIVLDAYNANPTSMEAAIESFALFKSNRPKVAVLGKMLELGKYSAEEHYRIAVLAASKGFDRVFFIGNDYPNSIPGTLYFDSSAQLMELLKTSPLQSKAILLKGSRGARMEQLLELL